MNWKETNDGVISYRFLEPSSRLLKIYKAQKLKTTNFAFLYITVM